MSCPCKYDYESPCEDCGRCNRRLHHTEIDERHNEEYHTYSDDGGVTWHEENGWEDR